MSDLNFFKNNNNNNNNNNNKNRNECYSRKLLV